MNTTFDTETRGIKARCPKCGDDESLAVRVSDVDEVRCLACDEAFTRADLRVIVADYQALLDWLDRAPPYPAEG